MCNNLHATNIISGCVTYTFCIKSIRVTTEFDESDNTAYFVEDHWKK